MIQTATINPVAPRVALHAADVALRDFGQQPLDRTSRMREIELLGLPITVVEVQAALAGATVHTASLCPDPIQDRAVSLDVAVDAASLCSTPARVSGLLTMTLPLARFVALPCLRRVVALAAGHMGILRDDPDADTWGNEALEHVEMPA